MGMLLKILLLVGALSAIASALVFGKAITIAFLTGLILMTGNVALTGSTVRQFTSGSRASMAGLYVVKMILLFGLLYVCLAVFRLDVFGVIAGLSLPMMLMILSGNRWMNAEPGDGVQHAPESENALENGV